MSIVVRGVFRARPGRVEAFRSVALALQRAAADEPGTLRYAWYADDEPSSFVVIEEYVDAAAARAHNEHCAALLDQAGELAEMTAVDLHGDLDPVLAAWVAERPQARAHPPLGQDGAAPEGGRPGDR